MFFLIHYFVMYSFLKTEENPFSPSSQQSPLPSPRSGLPSPQLRNPGQSSPRQVISNQNTQEQLARYLNINKIIYYIRKI